ncbi:MAG TPA: ATP12 family protein [Novosphingobium sp.]|nr:ATP12 family protein [Novosphingobium sp.]
MKRFWGEVVVVQVEGGWQVTLDGRPLKTPQKRAQVVPTPALAEALAAEWRAQSDTVDPAGFVFRDLADYAIDVVAPGRAEAVARLLAFAETDTLCYRAEPDEPLAARQRAAWEPLLKAAEARHGVRFERVAGIVHRAQPAETLERLHEHLDKLDAFALAALHTLAGLAASLVVALAALEPGADAAALWAAANLEEDWQAEQWGVDAEAQALRARRLAQFEDAARFATLARFD